MDKGSIHGSVPGVELVGLRSHNQNVDKNFKTLKYFFKHPIKNILTIRPLKTFLETISGSGRGWGGGPTRGHFPRARKGR